MLAKRISPAFGVGTMAVLLALLPLVIAIIGLGFMLPWARFEAFSQWPYVLGVLRFSLWQALLSSLVSVLLALPVAWVLYRFKHLVGRRHFLALCLLNFVMPTFVLVTALVNALGRDGWFQWLLPESWTLYGTQGVVLAHISLNMPLAIRVLYLALTQIPDTAWRLARSLRLSRWQQVSLIILPALRASLWAVTGLIFLLCFNSFAIVLALGGGPQASTIEVVIYQALKYEFDVYMALRFVVLQLVITGVFFVAIQRRARVSWLAYQRVSHQWRAPISSAAQWLGWVIYGLAWCLMLFPLVALISKLSWSAWTQISLPLLMNAIGMSLHYAVASAVIALVLAYALAVQMRRSASYWLKLSSSYPLLIPAMILSVGAYLLLVKYALLETWGGVLLVFINGVVALPFVMALLLPRLQLFDKQYSRLTQTLKLPWWSRLWVEFRAVKTTVLTAFSLALVLSLGEVTVFSLLGPERTPSLPWLVYQYAGSYRMEAASLVSLLLLGLCALFVGLFELAQRHREE